MTSKRKRKQPIVSQAKGKGAAISAKATQSTIATFHTLLKRRAVLQKQLAAKATQTLQAELDGVNTKIEELGGIEGYQHASTLGQSQQRGGDSSKVLIEWLKEIRKEQQEPPRLR